MITFDTNYKQILTNACLHCRDPYFLPANPTFIHAGCCSYSPVLGLFEIYQMIKDGNREYFINTIYNHKAATIKPYEIIIHANVHPQFDQLSLNHLSHIEKADIRLQYSVCQFFEPQKGCGLPGNYKNTTCRSFICLSVEDQLDEQRKSQLKKWNTLIYQEVKTFVKQHRKALQSFGMNLQTDVQSVLNYLEVEGSKN
ncbi:hypothetical protein DS745_16195 [Anaerobacillus alkaliphilus]|uniref:YkgJ family cysteine cluster protein n=1 Tax=Anaerobacillus alkaliphilus TaxID=1548597 RepID=A0A4Q0VPQ1_9BACI|nr:hypothetical protein [Anaerobacillus alkaliphilus]RXI97895.1 hypothetical protein DS745_16195 [Anaerobacillus alkaliphilus]